MDEHQKVRRLGMLAAGFVLGCLASVGLRGRRAIVPAKHGRAELVRPGQGPYPGTAPQDQPRKKKRGILTNNAVVAGVVSAIVAGVISFAVAHYQSKDAARQATIGQQVQEIGQLETDIKTFYNAAHSYYKWRAGCGNLPNGSALPPKCKQQNILDSPLVTNYVGSEGNLELDLANISDPVARKYTGNLEGYVDTALYNAGTELGNTAWGNVNLEYYDVIQRCGQLIQGRNRS